MQYSWISVLAIAIAAAACVTDIRSRRIPNVLTFGAAGAALTYHAASGGLDGLLSSGAGWLVGAILFMPFFLLRGMGAGDVKLIAALGAWLGPREAMWLAVYCSLAGGAIGIVVALNHGYLGTAMRNIGCLFRYWLIAGVRPAPGLTLESSTSPRLAYAIPILVGTAVTVWLR